jgi:UDPglucose--hexose-1-phosphate uridylyltransferase
VIVAKNRADRPDEFARAAANKVAMRCPFCQGHEEDTPYAIATYPDGEGDWQVRVVPNKYPALFSVGELTRQSDGLWSTLGGVGAHEVIIESPEHVSSLTDLSPQQARLAFCAYRDRLRELKQDRRLAHGLVFKNVGSAAGASLEHTHSQLVATPMVPTDLHVELSRALDYYLQHGQCLFCVLIEQELASAARIVAESPQFVAFCPFAGRFPFETWVFPRRHASRFDAASDDVLCQLCGVVQDVIGRIEAVLDRPAYNYVIHSAPFDISPFDHYHWHMEIFPRVTRTAGLEWGAGCFINATPPDEAATLLRNVQR